MGKPLPFELGSATAPFFWFVAGVLFTLIFVAVMLELRRRHRSHRQQIMCERKLVDEIADEKKFTAEEKNTLLTLINIHFPEKPLAVVKERALFDQAVEQQVAAVEARGDERALRKQGLLLRAVREKLDFQYVPVGQRIWTTRELYEGQIVWLATKEDPPRWYEAVVSAVDDAFLHLAMMGDRAGQPWPFKVGDTVRCRLWREDDARYLFALQITSCEGQPPICSMRHTSDLNRMQAREFYRVHYTQKTDLGLVHKEEEQPEEEEKTSEAVVHHDMRIVAQWPAHFMSLSAGGFSVVAQKPLPVRAAVKVRIELPGEEPFEAQATTVGEEKLPGECHLIRGQFVDLSEEKRDQIARYITLRQQPALNAERRE